MVSFAAMKVLSGKYRNRNFYMPKDIRPTQNMLRKAVFDILGHDLSGLKLIDLCAGSGAVGIEAISNGADFVTFVEKDPKNARLIEDNLRLLDPQIGRDQYNVINGDIFSTIKLLAKQKKVYDIIFIDPPYGQGMAKKALKILELHDILAPHCFVVAQYDKFEKIEGFRDDCTIIKDRAKYGASFLSIFER